MTNVTDDVRVRVEAIRADAERLRGVWHAGRRPFRNIANRIEAMADELDRLTADNEQLRRERDEARGKLDAASRPPDEKLAKLLDRAQAQQKSRAWRTVVWLVRCLTEERAALARVEKQRDDLLHAVIELRYIGAGSGTDLNAWNKAFDVIDRVAALAGGDDLGATNEHL